MNATYTNAVCALINISILLILTNFFRAQRILKITGFDERSPMEIHKFEVKARQWMTSLLSLEAEGQMNLTRIDRFIGNLKSTGERDIHHEEEGEGKGEPIYSAISECS